MFDASFVTGQLGGTLASVPGLPCYVRVLICGGGNNAVKRGRPGLTDHVMGRHGIGTVTKICDAI